MRPVRRLTPARGPRYNSDHETMEKGRQAMTHLDRITFDRHIMAGQACIRGMRIPVSLIINLIAHGKQTADILAEYPDLEPEDIQQALEYAAWLTREHVYVGQSA